MSYSKERLLSFKEMILQNTKEKATKLKNEVLQQRQEELEKIKQQSLIKISSQTEEKIKKIKKDYEYKINKKNLDINKNFLNHRNKLIEQLFEICKNKIKDFSKTQEYEKYIIKKIEKHLKNDNFKDVTVIIRHEDIKFEKEILKIEQVKKVEVDAKISLGGIKIFDEKQKIEIDETFDAALIKITKKFHQTSLLNLKNFNN